MFAIFATSRNRKHAQWRPKSGRKDVFGRACCDPVISSFSTLRLPEAATLMVQTRQTHQAIFMTEYWLSGAIFLTFGPPCWWEFWDVPRRGGFGFLGSRDLTVQKVGSGLAKAGWQVCSFWIDSRGA